jgi:hypothetical protein
MKSVIARALRFMGATRPTAPPVEEVAVVASGKSEV